MFYKNEESIKSEKFIPTCKMPILSNKKNSNVQVFNVDNSFPNEKAFKFESEESPLDNIPLSKLSKKPSKMLKSTSHDDIFSDASEQIQVTSKSSTDLSGIPVALKTNSLGDSSFLISKNSTPNVNHLLVILLNINLKYCNPFDLKEFENQSFFIKKKSKQTKQWSHLFPTMSNLVQGKNSSFMKMFEIQWKILIEPALLPVTNDYWPSNDEL
jgi:hypothetical protein